MLEVRTALAFDRWLEDLRDMRARQRIIDRIERAQHGNFGDTAPVGQGVSEMRIHYGPGYRVYFVQQDSTLIILLCGGDKRTQKADIAHAKAMAKEA